MARKHKVRDHPELLGMPDVKKLWQTEGLFSDHYLKVRLRKNDWWPTDAEVQPVWNFCKELYEKRYLVCARNNEAFTRQELLDKILEYLGFAWTDNLGLPDQDAEPDYILFASSAEKESVISGNSAERYRAAVGISEARKVNHPLSQRSKHQQRYPHQQIRDYLNDAQLLTWGILSNGNEWRLYCRDTKPSHFFALNFEIAIKSLEDFKVFFALFGPSAFTCDDQGKCRLDHVRDQASDAQVSLELCNLEPKTKFDEFWKLEAAELSAHLRRNTKRLAVQGVRLTEADDEKIRTRFQDASQAILPLEAQIAFTDNLIDQIVYRLYGLTEEEIKTVKAVVAQ